MDEIDPAIELREVEGLIAEGATPSPLFKKVVTLVRKRGTKRLILTRFMNKIKAEVYQSSDYEVKSFINSLQTKFEELYKLDNEILEIFVECEEYSYDSALILCGSEDHYIGNIFTLINELKRGKVKWETSSEVLDEGVYVNLPVAQEVLDEQCADLSLDVCECKEYSSDLHEALIPFSKELKEENIDAAVGSSKCRNTFSPIEPYYPILQPSLYNSPQIHEINLNSDLVTAPLIAKFIVPRREISKIMLEASTYSLVFENLNITLSTECILNLYKELCNTYCIKPIQVQSFPIYVNSTMVLSLLYTYLCERKSLKGGPVLVKIKFPRISERPITPLLDKFENCISPCLFTEPLKLSSLSPLPTSHKSDKSCNNLDELILTVTALSSKSKTTYNKKKITSVLNVSLKVKNDSLEHLKECFLGLKFMKKCKVKFKNYNETFFPFDRGKFIF